jgi:hypothetical protein
MKEIKSTRGFPGFTQHRWKEYLLSHILQIFVVMLGVEFVVLLFCFIKNLPLERPKAVKKI